MGVVLEKMLMDFLALGERFRSNTSFEKASIVLGCGLKDIFLSNGFVSDRFESIALGMGIAQQSSTIAKSAETSCSPFHVENLLHHIISLIKI